MNLLNVRDWILWIENPPIYSIIHASSENAETLISSFRILIEKHKSSLEKGNGVSLLNFDGQNRDMLILPIHQNAELFGVLSLFRDSSKLSYQKELEILRDFLGQWAIFLGQVELGVKVGGNNHLYSAQWFEGKEISPDIHHELRTPLVAILGFSKMLNQEIYGKLNEKQKQYVQNIVSSGEYLLDLVNNFLDIFKIDANEEKLFWEILEARDLCLSAISMVEPRSIEKGLKLNFVIAPEVRFIRSDARKLKQILVNLLSNAVKFTDQGSIKLEVKSKGNKILFSIIDTGIGIDSTELEKIFDPFRQAGDLTREQEKGTGLGLAISRKLAKLHGGDIDLISEHGKGSCFILTIPLDSHLSNSK